MTDLAELLADPERVEEMLNDETLDQATRSALNHLRNRALLNDPGLDDATRIARRAHFENWTQQRRIEAEGGLFVDVRTPPNEAGFVLRNDQPDVVAKRVHDAVGGFERFALRPPTVHAVKAEKTIHVELDSGESLTIPPGDYLVIDQAGALSHVSGARFEALYAIDSKS